MEEEEGAQSSPSWSNTDKSRVHIVGKCALFKEERDVLKEG